VDLLLSIRSGQGCTVVEVGGDLDLATEPQLRHALRPVVEAGVGQVVVDLAGVGFMDSSALGTLVVTFKKLRDGGGRLCLAAAQEPVRELLLITSVDKVIDVYDTVAAAEASMRPGGDGSATVRPSVG